VVRGSKARAAGAGKTGCHKTMFEQFALEPVWRAYSVCDGEDAQVGCACLSRPTRVGYSLIGGPVRAFMERYDAPVGCCQLHVQRKPCRVVCWASFFRQVVLPTPAMPPLPPSAGCPRPDHHQQKPRTSGASKAAGQLL